MTRTLRFRKQKKTELRFEKQQFNKLFDNSQRKVYDKFRDILSDNDQPLYKTRPRQVKYGEIAREEVEKFWRPIWKDMKEVKLNADWINTVTNTISVSYSENINLKKDNIWKCIRKKQDWTSPGKDRITNFWLKNLCSIHEGLAIAISEMINKELPLPSWLVEGRTILIPKNDNPGALEYRPITCLNCNV